MADKKTKPVAQVAACKHEKRIAALEDKVAKLAAAIGVAL